MRGALSTLRYIASHPLASRHPARAVARYFWWQAASRLRAEIACNWVGGARLLARRGMAGATGNIYCGLHEFYEMGFLLHLLRTDDLFVDVGANVGSYTVLAAAVCGANSIAIEPARESMAQLRRNVDANAIGRRVECVECAAGPVNGVIGFTSGRDTMNQVAADSASGVPMATLDRILAGRRPTLIKIDVEGYEAEVVEGAPAVLACDRLLAVVTENARDTEPALERAGFRRRRYDPFARALTADRGEASPYALNYLFVRNEAAVLQRLRESPRRWIAGEEL